MTTCAQRSGSQTRWRSAQQRIHLGGKTWRHGDVPVNGGANGAFSDAERWENDTWYHILIKMVTVIQLNGNASLSYTCYTTCNGYNTMVPCIHMGSRYTYAISHVYNW